MSFLTIGEHEKAIADGIRRGLQDLVAMPDTKDAAISAMIAVLMEAGVARAQAVMIDGCDCEMCMDRREVEEMSQTTTH
jgi:hypothetical protein